MTWVLWCVRCSPGPPADPMRIAFLPSVGEIIDRAGRAGPGPVERQFQLDADAFHDRRVRDEIAVVDVLEIALTVDELVPFDPDRGVAEVAGDRIAVDLDMRARPEDIELRRHLDVLLVEIGPGDEGALNVAAAVVEVVEPEFADVIDVHLPSATRAALLIGLRVPLRHPRLAQAVVDPLGHLDAG